MENQSLLEKARSQPYRTGGAPRSLEYNEDSLDLVLAYICGQIKHGQMLFALGKTAGSALPYSVSLSILKEAVIRGDVEIVRKNDK